MTLLDFSIIYLACGAPFAVYRRYMGDASWWLVVLAALVWPYFALSLAFASAVTSPECHANEIETLRREFERVVQSSSTPEVVFHFRETYERYTGLAIAVRESDAPAAGAVLEITNHPSRSLAEACMLRSQRAKLLRHVNKARVEFAAFIAGERSSGLDELIFQLADAVDDPALTLEISHAAPVPPTDATVIAG